MGEAADSDRNPELFGRIFVLYVFEDSAVRQPAAKGDTMAKLSRAQERDERRKMGKGMTTSVTALILCWVPLLGVLLAAIGHISVMRCITVKFRKRFLVYSVLTVLILILCAGVLVVEVYAYSRNPNIVADTGTWLLESITGQSVDGGYLEDDYTGDSGFGMGMDDDLFSQGYFDAEGNFVYYPDDMDTGADGSADVTEPDV